MMTIPTVVIVSFWRNDAARSLDARVAHLLAKTAPEGMRLRHLWVVGDSTDATWDTLWYVATAKSGWPDDPHPDMDLQVMRADTHLLGEDTPTRRRRGAATATQAFAAIRADDHFVLLHESDLQTPIDIVAKLDGPWGRPGDAEAHAGWPVLGEPPVFYDIYAYRHRDGRLFRADEPQPAHRFEVGSFGSCWFAPAALVRNRVLGEDCVVDLCRQWKREGVHLWVDPTVTVVQPVDLWTQTAF